MSSGKVGAAAAAPPRRRFLLRRGFACENSCSSSAAASSSAVAMGCEAALHQLFAKAYDASRTGAGSSLNRGG